MESIPLPANRAVQAAGPAVVAVAVLLVLASPVIWPLRLSLAVLILGWGGGLWLRYLARRPQGLRVTADGRAWCTDAAGRDHEILALDRGLVRPWLVSVRLHCADGRRRDLLVSARCIDGQAHWRLRRLLLAFRPPGAQSAGRRGT